MIHINRATRELLNDTNFLVDEAAHLTYVFPENTEFMVEFTAGVAVNTFGEWAEIEDNDSVGGPDTLSSKALTKGLHVAGVQIEDVSEKDKSYLIEISYGDSKVVMSRHRFKSGTNVNPTIQQQRIRNVQIPAGEVIYYRMACEVANATCEVVLRYHLHK